jgi:hypothetical protein
MHDIAISLYMADVPRILKQKKAFRKVAALLLTIFLFPTAAFDFAALGIDPSWALSINMAVQQDLVFGRDWIFTFGPLGYLFTRNPYGIVNWPLLLYDVFVAVNVFFVVSCYLRRLNSNRALLVFLLIIFLLLRGAWESFILFYLFLFYLFYALEHKKPQYLLVALLLCLLIFYIKLNLGLVVIACFFAYLVYVWVSRAFNPIHILGLLILYAGLTWLSAKALNVYLPGYIKGALHLIDAYNDTMAISEIRSKVLILIMAVSICLLYALVLILYLKQLVKIPNYLLLYIMVGLTLFLLFKTSFVRARWTMVGEFHIHAGVIFVYSTLFASLLYYFAPAAGGLNRYFSRFMVLALVLCVAGLNLLIWGYGARELVASKMSLYQKNYLKQKYPGLKAENLDKYKISFKDDGFRFVGNSILYTLPYQYLKDVASVRNIDAYGNSARVKRMLPEKFLRKIDSSTVDILPYEISYIYFNELNYNPRPVVQSYSAYDNWLDSINAAKYLSATAPDFLLFQNKSIDRRYPFWDETSTKIAIYTHYTVADSALLAYKEEPMLLMKKKEDPETLNSHPLPSASVKLGDTLYVPSVENILLMYADVEYNLEGKLKRFFFQPPALEVTMIDEKGDVESYRAIVPILQGGVIANYKVAGTGDAYLFFSGQKEKNKRIRKMVFKSLGDGFKPKIHLRFEELR